MGNHKIDYSSKICCPHCGEYTRSLKYYNMVTKRIYFFYYFEIGTTPLVGCPKCINRQNFWRTFNDNIIKANIAWPILHLPIALITFIRSITPGHSGTVKYYIDQYNQNEINSFSKVFHNWSGIPCIPPPFSLLLKKEVKKTVKRAIELKSFVWLIKAWCYLNREIFYVNFNGHAIACAENTLSPGFVAFDSEKSSELFYRDFFVIPYDFNHLLQESQNYLDKLQEELNFIVEKDSQGNIHIHAKCLYDVNFNDNPISQLDWIMERVIGIRNDFAKWFNNAKIGSIEQTQLL
ncbi:MAG: hypothetical protein J1F05_02320 [Muribaculaceae bacterium]|nr:hypothetical protein [Muribaculaceae bacterium]